MRENTYSAAFCDKFLSNFHELCEKGLLPRPGIEPGAPGLKAAMLTTQPQPLHIEEGGNL